MGGSSAGSYLADPTSPIPSHCASIVVTSTVRVNTENEVTLSNTKLKLNSRNSIQEFSIHDTHLQNFFGMSFAIGEILAG